MLMRMKVVASMVKAWSCMESYTKNEDVGIIFSRGDVRRIEKEKQVCFSVSIYF